MTDRLYLFKEEASFSQGEMHDVCLHKDGLSLAHDGSGYALRGTYVSAPVKAPAFTALIASWNAAAPQGCTVQMSARVQVGEQWSNWVQWGTWGVFVPRASTQSTDDPLVRLQEDKLHVLCAQGATAFQLRVELCGTGIETPVVHLVSASIKVLRRQPQLGEPILHKSVPVPGYSLHCRDPRLGLCAAAPTACAMLLNRWGEDVLPEEAAYACYDYATHRYDNRSFAIALAGAYGFECYAVFTDVAGLKREVRNGFGAGVCLCSQDETNTMVVRGFETDPDGIEYVLLNNPLAASDAEALCRMELSEFVQQWDASACLLHRRTGERPCGPVRIAGELRRTELPGEYALHVKGKRHSIPTDLCTHNGRCSGTVCYTVQDSHAYATTAHKRFFYTDISPSGNLRLDTTHMPAGTRLTAYIITELGQMVVAGLTV